MTRARTKGRRRERGERSCGSAIAAALLLGAAAPSGAAIPEPEHRFYGQVTEDGELVAEVEVAVHRDGCASEVLATGMPGAVETAPELYLLTVPLEHPTGAEPPSAGTARVGDVATLCVTADGQTTPLQQLYIGDRGVAVRIDIDLAAALAAGPGGPDFDADGVPDFADNCPLPNAGQGDADGNGVGDACEVLVNRPVDDLLLSVEDLANPADSNGLGAVGYPFTLSGLEVTNVQYAAFLTAVAAAEDPYGFYNPLMASDPRGGITRGGDPGARSYAVKPNMGDKPVNFVSWVDAAAFANWVNNGQPAGPLATALTGAFDLTVADPGVSATLQDDGWSLPNEQEWYKAAYHDPERGGTPWWLYPTRDDTDPLTLSVDAVGQGTNPGANVSNYDEGADWNGQDGNVATVGSSGATSYYGSLDMGGNVAEWLADDAEGGLRRVRGGSYRDGISALASSAGDGDLLREPTYEGPDVGMRLLAVPEPGVLGLHAAALAAVLVLARVGRRRVR